MTEEYPVLLTPRGNRLVFFAEIPHMLKLLRGHYIREGYKYKDTVLNCDKIRVLNNVQQHTDLKFAPKLTEEHLNVTGARAQKVSLAAQLLSNKVAAGIRHLWETDEYRELMPRNTLENAEFVDTVNQWFDLFNVGCSIIDFRPSRQAYGRCLVEQDAILNRMTSYMKDMVSAKTGGKIPFQTGILANINGLRILRQILLENYGVEEVWTRKLQQDDLERFFCTIRYKGGGMNDHPTPFEFLYRLKNCILGRSDAAQQLADYSNIETD